MNQSKQQKIDWKLLFPLMLGIMLNPLNSTMLSTALITICNQFGRGIGSSSLLITPLYIAASIGQPLMGKLADIFNPKTVNKFGFLLVLIATLIGAFAPSFAWLVVSRVFLGLGTSAAYPSALAIVAHKYRQKAHAVPKNILSVIAISSRVSMVIGPFLGGFLTEWMGWQGIFYVNIPIVILALYFSKNILSIKRKQNNTLSVFKRIDTIGILSFALFLISLLIALTLNGNKPVLEIVGILSFAYFFYHERKHPAPFINIRLLGRQPAMLLVYARTISTSYILYLLLYAFPQWIEGVRMLSPSVTGLIMLPMSFISGFSAIYMTKIRKLARVAVIAMLCTIMVCVGMFLLNSHISIIYVILITTLIGLASGANGMANQLFLNTETKTADTGVSFGLFRTFNYMGAIISGIQMKTLFKNGLSDQSLHTAAICASVSCSVLIVLYLWSFFLKRKTNNQVIRTR